MIINQKGLLLGAISIFGAGFLLPTGIADQVPSPKLRITGSQITDIASLKFEVATVKPSDPRGGSIGFYAYPSGRIKIGQSTLRDLISMAYDVEPFQISDGPAWAGQDKFEVIATCPDSIQNKQSHPGAINSPPTDEQRAMLRSLLADRFGLRLHKVTKRAKALILMRGTGPLHMDVAHNPKELPWMAVLYVKNDDDGELAARNASLSFVARRLSHYLEQPVENRTDIRGAFDFHVPKWDGSVQDLFSGIANSLSEIGLKLVAGDSRYEIVVIDTVAKPTGN